jgi:hypothetical protein
MLVAHFNVVKGCVEVGQIERIDGSDVGRENVAGSVRRARAGRRPSVGRVRDVNLTICVMPNAIVSKPVKGVKRPRKRN